MDDSRLWDLFLVMLGAALEIAFDEIRERARRAPKPPGKHFKEP